MPGKPQTKRGHRWLAVIDFPEQGSISLLEDPPFREVGRIHLKALGFGTISFCRLAVAGHAFLLVENFSLGNRGFVGVDRIFLALEPRWSCPRFRLLAGLGFRLLLSGLFCPRLPVCRLGAW